jgi:hypothetical protein
MIGINLDEDDKYHIHETCCHCGHLIEPDENGKIHALRRWTSRGHVLSAICMICLEKMIKKEGLWKEKLNENLPETESMSKD